MDAALDKSEKKRFVQMNALIQEALLSTRHVLSAAVIKMTAADYARIELAFENPREVRSGEAAVTLADAAFRAVRADNLSLYAKNDKCGVIVARTHSHYIIGTYDGTMFASVCAEAVEKLAFLGSKLYIQYFLP
ncbi:Profilin-4 [Cladochytrium tenue]|nr:Profilin-4 [Cladochytrium tenue]